jgi:hypothetical protein
VCRRSAEILARGRVDKTLNVVSSVTTLNATAPWDSLVMRSEGAMKSSLSHPYETLLILATHLLVDQMPDAAKGTALEPVLVYQSISVIPVVDRNACFLLTVRQIKHA